VAILTDKKQALVRAIRLRGIAAHRACLAGVVGIDIDRHAANQSRFVGDVAVQFGKRPLGGMPVSTSLFLADCFALASFGPLSNVCQLFQADDAVWVRVHDAATDQVIAILFQPSLSPTDHDKPSCRGASALLLQQFSQTAVVVGFGPDRLAGIKACAIVGGRHDRQVALAHIDPHDLLMRLGCRARDLYFQGDEQVELLVWLVIPELGRPDVRSMLDQRHMLLIARVGHNHAPIQGQDAHTVLRLETVVTSKLVVQRRRDILRSSIQPFVAFLRLARFAQSSIALDLRPQGFEGGSDLAGDRAGHLRRYLEAGAYLAVGAILQSDLVAHLTVLERIATDEVQGITIGQLRGSQCVKLFRRRLQFEFGNTWLFHRTLVLHFTAVVKGRQLMNDTHLPMPQKRNAAFLPMARSQRHPAAEFGEERANTK